MRIPRLFACVAMLAGFAFSAAVSAQTYSVAIGDLPQIDSLYQLVKTMGEDMKVTLAMKKVPMARLAFAIQEKQADFGSPMLYLKDQEKIKQLPFAYSSAVINKMCFILYTNKSKPVDIDNLKKGNSKKYTIESDVGNMQLFNFTPLPSTNIVGSLKKVNDGVIDGYIMGVSPTDEIIKASQADYKNIKRQLWEIYDMGFAIQKGGSGPAVDKFLVDAMAKMVSSGKFDKIMGTTGVGTYVDWQP